MDEKYDRRSRLTGRHYNLFDSDIVRIVNIMQAMAYIKNNALPIDIYVGKDRQDESKDILIFLFSKKETKEVYDLWCKHELK